MTKEELYESMYFGFNKEMIKDSLDQFFDSNVCIPKGENCHPDADVIHAYAEGGEVEVNVNTNLQPKWNKFALGHQYRIKPLEPAYETMWYNSKGSTKWMTKEESDKDSEGWFIATYTSRVRQ